MQAFVVRFFSKKIEQFSVGSSRLLGKTKLDERVIGSQDIVKIIIDRQVNLP